ncbi:MAG: DUF3040 domain-containing protein [Acidimicrobiia bacterium]|nr:DUF3040 domain-containing protein [Acidimicrobiia bacterium]
MPLSEDEQRILSQIEEQLYETDPDLAHEVGSTTVYTDSRRNLFWATLGGLVGLGVMVFTLSTSYLVSFLGFVILLISALFVERSLRQLGKISIEQLTQTIRRRPIRGIVDNAGRRFRRENDDDDSDSA